MAVLFNPRASGRPSLQQMQLGASGFSAGAPGTPAMGDLKALPYTPRPAQRPNGSYVTGAPVPAVGPGSHANFGTRGGSAGDVVATPAPAPVTPVANPNTSNRPPVPGSFGATSTGGGLGSMGIPRPTPSQPRPAYTPIPLGPTGNYNPVSTNTGNNTAGNGLGAPNPNYGGYYNYRDFANDVTNRVSNYTGGVIHSSNPVTPGSAVNGGIGGPGAAAALGAWQNAQTDAQLRQAFGDRGPQFALRDLPSGPSYAGGSLAAQNAASGGQARDSQGRPVWRDAGGNITYTPPAGYLPPAAPAPMTPATPTVTPTTDKSGTPAATTPTTATQAAASTTAPAATAASTTTTGSNAAGANATGATTYTGGSSAGYTGYGVDPNAQAAYNNQILNKFSEDVHNQQEQARQANEQRYQDILTGRGAQYDREMGMLAGMGDYTRGQINLSAQRQVAANTQRALDSGLGGSTIMPSLQNQTYFERNQNLGQLDQQLREQALGVDQRVTEGTLATMENRSDNAPSTESLMNLAMQLGQSGNGGYVPPVQNIPQYDNSYGYGVPYNGAMMGIDYVSNGLDGGGYGQPVGSYMNSMYGGGGFGYGNYFAAPQVQQVYQPTVQQTQRQPTFMERQRAAISGNPYGRTAANASNWDMLYNALG